MRKGDGGWEGGEGVRLLMKRHNLLLEQVRHDRLLLVMSHFFWTGRRFC